MFEYNPNKHRCINDIIKDFFYIFGYNDMRSRENARFTFSISMVAATEYVIPELSQAIRDYVTEHIKDGSLVEFITRPTANDLGEMIQCSIVGDLKEGLRFARESKIKKINREKNG